MKQICFVIFIAIIAMFTMTTGAVAEDYQTQCCEPPLPPPPPDPLCLECNTYTGDFGFGGSTYLADPNNVEAPSYVANGGYDGMGSFDVTSPNTNFYGEAGGEGYSESWTEEWCNGRKIIQNSGGIVWVGTNTD